MVEQSPIERQELYKTGVTKSRGFELDGEMHGQWEFFRLDGSLMRAGEFDRGAQIGVWRTYARDGRLVKETQFGPERPA